SNLTCTDAKEGNVLGAIEAGGTKFVCAVGTGPEDLALTQLPTTSPKATIGSAVTFLKEHSGGRLQAVGIGSFGPVDLCPSSPTLGCISSTPNQVGRIMILPVQYPRLLVCRSGSIPM